MDYHYEIEQLDSERFGVRFYRGTIFLLCIWKPLYVCDWGKDWIDRSGIPSDLQSVLADELKERGLIPH